MDTEEIFDDYFQFLDSDVTAILFQVRRDLEYSQRKMAAYIGVARSVYRDWEKGRKISNRASFEKIKRFLKNCGEIYHSKKLYVL